MLRVRSVSAIQRSGHSERHREAMVQFPARRAATNRCRLVRSKRHQIQRIARSWRHYHKFTTEPVLSCCSESCCGWKVMKEGIEPCFGTVEFDGSPKIFQSPFKAHQFQ